MNDNFEDILNKYGELTYTSKGFSMLPMLRPERDVFTVEKKTSNRCKENDVVLFKMNGKYILHRIVEVFDDSYTLRGDNCINSENNITDDQIIGVMSSFQRNNTKYLLTDCRYSMYVFLIRLFEKPRIIIKKASTKLKATIRSHGLFI